MPYKVYKSGNQWCVHKKNPDGSKGRKMGCHSSAVKARQQQEALYVNEKEQQEDNMAQMPDAVIEVVEKNSDGDTENKEKERIEKGYVPWGITSFVELEAAREAAEAAEKTYDLMSDYTGLVFNILENSTVEDKVSLISQVTKDLEIKLKSSTKEQEPEEPQWRKAADKAADKVIDWFKSAFTNEEETAEDKNEFMTWKEVDGTVRWLATYSNKFRDNDRPYPEIISEISHKKFEELVDTKQVPMPELWLWHTPAWKFGVADWIAWDDEGFAIASGKVDEGKESVAEWIGEQKDVAVSHGMPKESIVRDPDDPTIIVGHITREISPLPAWAAANPRTDFLILGNGKEKSKQEDDMAISDDKKKKLQEDWDAPAHILSFLEAKNVDVAQEAKSEGVDFKENEETVEQEGVTSEAEQAEATSEETAAPPEAEEQETQAEDDSDAAPEYPTREEVVEAIAPMAKDIAELKAAIEPLGDLIKELAKSDDEKVAEKATELPSATVAAMIAKQMTAVGSEEAEMDEDDELKDSKPEEAKEGNTGPTKLAFLNEIVDKQYAPQQQ